MPSLVRHDSAPGSFVDASDFDAAYAEVDALYEAEGDEVDVTAGTEWVLQTCGVDLED